MKKLGVLILLLLTVCLSGCHLSNQILAKRMIEKYSDNQNYVTLSGEIVEDDESVFLEENAVLIRCPEIRDYIHYQGELCRYYIHTKEALDLKVGDQIDFVTVPFHFYNGHKLPIVELKLNGNTLLTFEEGKENLIEWVKRTFN